MNGDDMQTFWFRFLFWWKSIDIFASQTDSKATPENISVNKPFVCLLFMNALGKWTVDVDVTNKKVH